MGHTHWLLPHVAPLPHCQVPHHPPSLTNPLPALTSHTRLPPPSVGGRPCTSQGEGSSWSPWGWTEPHQPAATHQQPQQPVTHIHSSSSTRHAVPTEEVRACVIECVLAAQLQLAFQLHHLAVGQSAAACSRSRHTHPVCGHTTSAAAPGPKPPYTPPPSHNTHTHTPFWPLPLPWPWPSCRHCLCCSSPQPWQPWQQPWLSSPPSQPAWQPGMGGGGGGGEGEHRRARCVKRQPGRGRVL